MPEHDHLPSEDCTLEEFNKAIDETEDHGCSMCPSLARSKPHGPKLREIEWLGWLGREEDRQKLILEELEKSLNEPYGNNAYWLVLQCELMKTEDEVRRKRISDILFHYASKTVVDAAPEAWAVVRSYAWFKGFDPQYLLSLAGMTIDHSVVQVVLQCSFNCSLPYWEDKQRAQNIRDSVYRITRVAMEREDRTWEVPAFNGILALTSFQDERALELRDKQGILLGLQRTLNEHIVRIRSYIRDKGGDQSYFAVLEKLHHEG